MFKVRLKGEWIILLSALKSAKYQFDFGIGTAVLCVDFYFDFMLCGIGPHRLFVLNNAQSIKVYFISVSCILQRNRRAQKM